MNGLSLNMTSVIETRSMGELNRGAEIQGMENNQGDELDDLAQDNDSKKSERSSRQCSSCGSYIKIGVGMLAVFAVGIFVGHFIIHSGESSTQKVPNSQKQTSIVVNEETPDDQTGEIVYLVKGASTPCLPGKCTSCSVDVYPQREDPDPLELIQLGFEDCPDAIKRRFSFREINCAGGTTYNFTDILELAKNDGRLTCNGSQYNFADKRKYCIPHHMGIAGNFCNGGELKFWEDSSQHDSDYVCIACPFGKTGPQCQHIVQERSSPIRCSCHYNVDFCEDNIPNCSSVMFNQSDACRTKSIIKDKEQHCFCFNKELSDNLEKCPETNQRSERSLSEKHSSSSWKVSASAWTLLLSLFVWILT